MAIEFVGSTNGSGLPSASVTRPGGIQDGDVMLALHVSSSPVTPAGWSTAGVSPPFGTNNYAALHYKVVNVESEPSSYSFGNSTGSNNWAIIAVYRGVDTSVIFDTSHAYYQDDTGTPVTLPSLSTMANGALFIVVDATVIAFASRHPQVTGMTTDAAYASRARAFLSEIRPASGPTGERTLTRDGNTECGGILTALRPASGDPPGPTTKPWTRAFIVE